jgi:hypothetical protein
MIYGYLEPIVIIYSLYAYIAVLLTSHYLNGVCGSIIIFPLVFCAESHVE